MRLSAGTFVIAEAGVNHGGDVRRALEMVDVAAAAGADAVKFQSFRTARLVTALAPSARYQTLAMGGTLAQGEMLRGLELSVADFAALAERCRQRKIRFMATAFDRESLAELVPFDVPALKIASGDITAGPLLYAASLLGKPLLVSTGMSTLDDIRRALSVIAYGLLDGSVPSRANFEAAFVSSAGQQALRERVTLLHCVSQYPTPAADVNLRAMDAITDAFGMSVGYSDHAVGTAVALAAVARGACVIEKHFTLDRTLPGPDQLTSLEPAGLVEMVRDIRIVEASLGRRVKEPVGEEDANARVARRSLVAARPIRTGQTITESDVDMKRPQAGLSPMLYWDVVGTVATRDLDADAPLTW